MIEQIFYYGFAASTATLTFSKGKPLAWARRILKRIPFIRDLIKCNYCTMHYVVIILMLLIEKEYSNFLIIKWLGSVTIGTILFPLLEKAVRMGEPSE